MGQRMFVAVVPPDPVREHLAEFLDSRPGLRWSPPEQWHVTLAFLASVPDHVTDPLLERLARAASRFRPFQARIVGAGAFPHPARAAVLWLGLTRSATPVAGADPRHTERDLDQPLQRLAVASRNAANAAGATPDGRAFRAHVTLARLRPPADATKWLRVLDTYVGPDWLVERIALVASFLGQGPGGHPRYETVAELALGGPDE